MWSYSLNIIVVWGRIILTTLWDSKILHLITMITIVLTQLNKCAIKQICLQYEK